MHALLQQQRELLAGMSVPCAGAALALRFSDLA